MAALHCHSASIMSTPRSTSSSGGDGRGHVYESGGDGVSLASLNTPLASPFVLSPPPLPTPQTMQTISTSGQTTTTPTLAQLHHSRTPMTIQLQRLLQPTPDHETPAQQTAAAVSTPRTSTPSSNAIVPTTPSPYTIDQFLQQSGLPPKLSRTATNVVFTVLSWSLAIVDVIVGAMVSRFKEWWNKVISRKFPNTADVVEALLEYTLEVCQFLFKAGKFLSPYVLWLVKTLIATVLFIGGSFVCGVIVISKGRDAAENSGAGEVQQTAMKSLNESIQNSPFYSRKAVPFTPRFVTANVRVNASSNDHAAAAAAVGNIGGISNSTSFKSPPAANDGIPPKPSATKSTPPVSVMKRHSSFQSNPNTPNVAKPTPNPRRVLFSESEHGQVDTEQFFYDKTLPSASARKLLRADDNRQQLVIVADEIQTDAPNETSPTNSASNTPENTILRPSKFGPNGTSDKRIKQQSISHATTANQPNTAVKKQQAQQDEQNKQQYIKKYGLLPTITPLSKRYGRMKRQQGQSFAVANSSSRNVTAAATSTVNNNDNNNAKRKRRDLLSAASRMGRRRLNNHRTGGSSLPVVLLGKNHTPMKRRREDELNRADEWVWRAMNSDGEKENLDSQEGGSTKRAKFVNDVPAAPPGLSTPPQSVKKAFPSVTTPPKTPGPSTFSLGSSTPAPKSYKGSGIGATPAKTPLPSFTFNDTPSSSAGFSFGNKTSSSGGQAEDTPSVIGAATKTDQKDDTGPYFSFGSAATKNDNTLSSFSFGDTASKSDDAKTTAPFTFGASSSSTTAKQEEKQDSATFISFGAASVSSGEEKSQPFAFGGTSTPAPTGTQDMTNKAAFSFGSAGQINMPATSAPTPSETKQTPSFSFGGASTAAPSSGFTFGATNQTPAAAPTPAAATPSETKQTPSFSFGNSGATTPASTFSFGSNNQAPAESSSAGATPASSTFAFGSTNQTPAASMFAFGGHTPGGGGVSIPSSFVVGGSASGASARRRAASGRRK